MKPLVAGDPREVGGHRIVGRLGEGGQGVVYLGESPEGRQVAVKLLGSGLDDPGALDRFRQEAGYARRVKAFCTAQVLDGGEAGGLPYVVSEFVDGPSLAQVIQERGPLRGAELRRLAIGTLTALAAIHQAGVVHRDFKPGNVLLSRDGPRVIDFGISRAVEELEHHGDVIEGTPPYMAPEQFGGGAAGAPADMFAWASTMVATATGRPPFGTGPLPALIHRITRAEPALGELEGELRELAVRCLAKDPGERPTATQALLTLLGHRVPEQRLLAEGQQSAAPPSRHLRRLPPAVTVSLAVVAAVAVAAAVLLTRPSPTAVTSAGPAAGLPPAPSAGPMPLTSVSEVELQDTGITVHESPDDPVWVSSYHDQRKGQAGSYVRDPATRRFAFFGNLEEPIVSPGGGYVASLSSTRLQRTDFETIRLRERATGRDRDLRTVDKPATLFWPAWSPDGGAAAHDRRRGRRAGQDRGVRGRGPGGRHGQGHAGGGRGAGQVRVGCGRRERGVRGAGRGGEGAGPGRRGTAGLL
ncbi:serine/threonine protein kinase [Nonomuraea mesophila]|uniref:Serine/threonine protein kinase n=1 Tax=Nonomuraea mesophila TaxID=2530382 RepID=A0A4R5FNN2_9ACTN|nr:serine/threonine-protein kinase [Nonomuraea mesophila]TDE54575.1 serine/threonine protein kinase [Nonomuraea mesophila]